MFYYGTEDKKRIYDVVDEIHQAFLAFSKKAGYPPDTCILSIDSPEVDRVLNFDGHDVHIHKARYILPKNLWIGRESDEELKTV